MKNLNNVLRELGEDSFIMEAVILIYNNASKREVVEHCIQFGNSVEKISKLIVAVASEKPDETIEWLKHFASGTCGVYSDETGISSMAVDKEYVSYNNYRFVFSVFLALFQIIEKAGIICLDRRKDLDVPVDEVLKIFKDITVGYLEHDVDDYTHCVESERNHNFKTDWNKHEKQLSNCVRGLPTKERGFPREEIPLLKQTLGEIARELSKKEGKPGYMLKTVLSCLFYHICRELDTVQLISLFSDE